MNKLSTTGKRYLKDDIWHDDNGPIPDTPAEWDPPMTDAERHEAALSDPDNPPLTADQLARMRRVSRAKFVRQKLGMSRATFAATYDIPEPILASWERHEVEPSVAEMAYLRAIERAPEATKARETSAA